MEAPVNLKCVPFVFLSSSCFLIFVNLHLEFLPIHIIPLFLPPSLPSNLGTAIHNGYLPFIHTLSKFPKGYSNVFFAHGHEKVFQGMGSRDVYGGVRLIC
jgi:hypothetical protein